MLRHKIVEVTKTQKKMVFIDNDTIERIKVGVLVIVEICRVCMGCFTTVFVSSCTEECSFYDSLNPTSDFGTFALVANGSTCVLFLLLYIVEIHRENWMIEYLDHDPDLPPTHLHGHISRNLQLKLKMLNRNYWTIVLCTLLFFISNVIVSAIFIAGINLTLSTMSAFGGFTILLGQKIYYAATIAYIGRDGDVAQSSYLTFPLTFNTLDVTHTSKSSSKIIPCKT